MPTKILLTIWRGEKSLHTTIGQEYKFPNPPTPKMALKDQKLFQEEKKKKRTRTKILPVSPCYKPCLKAIQFSQVYQAIYLMLGVFKNYLWNNFLVTQKKIQHYKETNKTKGRQEKPTGSSLFCITAFFLEICRKMFWIHWYTHQVLGREGRAVEGWKNTREKRRIFFCQIRYTLSGEKF